MDSQSTTVSLIKSKSVRICLRLHNPLHYLIAPHPAYRGCDECGLLQAHRTRVVYLRARNRRLGGGGRCQTRKRLSVALRRRPCSVYSYVCVFCARVEFNKQQVGSSGKLTSDSTCASRVYLINICNKVGEAACNNMIISHPDRRQIR